MTPQEQAARNAGVAEVEKFIQKELADCLTELEDEDQEWKWVLRNQEAMLRRILVKIRALKTAPESKPVEQRMTHCDKGWVSARCCNGFHTDCQENYLLGNAHEEKRE